MASLASTAATTADLRRRAEALWQARRIIGNFAGPGPDHQGLIQELEIHQIELENQQAELETQNTQLAQTKSDLETALAKVTELYDFAPIGYLTLDQVGSIEGINLAGAEMLGRDRSALLGRRLALFLPPNERLALVGFLESVFVGKTRTSWEVSLVVEGRPPLEVELDGVASQSGNECKVVMTDRTERKRAAADRLILSKLESTGILAGGIAHDFNNLLAALVLSLDLARVVAPPHAEQLRFLDDAKETALLAAGLTQQLLTFAKGGEPQLQRIALPALIRESIRLALGGSRVRSEISLADDLWPVMADQGQIGQVLRNIVLNAREAMPEGGVIVVEAENVDHWTNTMPSLPQRGFVRVRVTDRGVGISRENLPKVFDPYFSTKERGSRKGMGLGLTICHTIIQKHEGVIEVESALGEGSSFSIYLPAAGGPEPDATALPYLSIPPHQNILVMDDEAPLRKVCERTIRRMGHEVVAVDNGERAIDAFKEAKSQGRPFAVVFLDLTIRDGMGGAETLLALRQIDSDVKAVVMSGYANDPLVIDFRLHGFAGALVKPFDSARIHEVLARLFAES